MAAVSLDTLDFRLLDALQEDARASYAGLGRLVRFTVHQNGRASGDANRKNNDD